MAQRIIIRHKGAQDPPVEEFPVDAFVELLFGREEGCQILYDPEKDETVSRRHAKLLLAARDPLQAAIADLGSRNGTFVNGRRIEGQVRLTPGDWIQLGAGGPEFQFDLDPPETPRRDLVTRAVMTPQAVGQPIPPPVATARGPVLQGPSARMQPGPALLQPLQRSPIPIPVQTGPAPSAGAKTIVMTAGLGLAVIGLTLMGVSLFARGNGVLSVKVYHQRILMSGAYKAYGNPEAAGGKYWFGKTILENTGKSSVKDIKVSYQIPDFINWTTPDEAPELLPGETAVFVYYPKFPAKVTGISTRTPSVLETKIEFDDGSGRHSRIEKREFEFFGLTEFAYTSVPETEIASRSDLSDNDELLASYVHDEDPVVKTFYAKISEASGGINTMEKRDSLIQMARSVYDYLVATGMTYSGAKGVPDRTGDVSSTVQSIRVPRDVIYGNSGLCIELALMWCSIGQAAGAKSYLVLVPGHAFTILASDDGFKLPIETTAIGGAGGANLGKAATFEQAVESAGNTFKKYQSSPLLEVLDIRDLQGRGIRPPELKDVDRAELVRLLDDRRAGRRPPTTVIQVARTGGAPARSSSLRSWRDPNGRVALSYPADWSINTQAIATIRYALPGYMFAAGDPTGSAAMDVAFFTAGNVQQVFQQYSHALSRLNLVARIGNFQQIQLGGRAVLMTPIAIAGGGGQSAGTLYISQVRGGFAMVGVSARQPGAEQWGPLLSAISGSVRFGN